MNEKQEKCPFCGCHASIGWMAQRNAVDGEFRTHSGKCASSSCAVRPSTIQFLTREEAIEAWNRRVPPPWALALARAVIAESHKDHPIFTKTVHCLGEVKEGKDRHFTCDGCQYEAFCKVVAAIPPAAREEIETNQSRL